jgi:hypothetical protein
MSLFFESKSDDRESVQLGSLAQGQPKKFQVWRFLGASEDEFDPKLDVARQVRLTRHPTKV